MRNKNKQHFENLLFSKKAPRAKGQVSGHPGNPIDPPCITEYYSSIISYYNCCSTSGTCHKRLGHLRSVAKTRWLTWEAWQWRGGSPKRCGEDEVANDRSSTVHWRLILRTEKLHTNINWLVEHLCHKLHAHWMIVWHIRTYN